MPVQQQLRSRPRRAGGPGPHRTSTTWRSLQVAFADDEPLAAGGDDAGKQVFEAAGLDVQREDHAEVTGLASRTQCGGFRRGS